MDTEQRAFGYGAHAGVALAVATGQERLLTKEVTFVQGGDSHLAGTCNLSATGAALDQDLHAALDDQVHAIACFLLAQDEFTRLEILDLVFRCLQYLLYGDCGERGENVNVFQ